MLAYLDALIDALVLRDNAAVRRLLAHPLVRILPAAVRDEADALAEGRCDALAAPLRAMQLRHRTAELLGDALPVADLADQPETVDAPRTPRAHAPAHFRRSARLVQMELPLSA